MLNTLVVHPGALGDVLLSLKAMRSLKRSFPQNSLMWVGKTEIGNLLVACGEVDDAISLEGRFLLDLFCSHDRWSAETCEILRLCTHIVCWLRDSDESIGTNLKTFGVPSVIMQSPYALSQSSTHTENRYVETLRDWEIKMIDCPERLRIVDRSYERLEPEGTESTLVPQRQRIVIHPGSGSPHKCSAPSFLASVVERLLQKDHREVIIMEGPADEEAVKSFCSALPSSTYKVVQNQSLSSVAQYFSNIDLFIGHDSGLTHLAAACGVTSIVLFGPTDPGQWAPRAKHVAIIQGESCQCVDWAEVQGCRLKPCLDISVERVVEQAEEWLSQPSIKFDNSTTPNLAQCP